jgi:hypothetical protein
MSGLPAGWVERARSQSWYPAVAREMAQEGVPEWEWLAIVGDEDASLDPNAAFAEADGSTSYGLFQFNAQPGMRDPVRAGAQAALWLARANASVGPNATPDQQISAAEAVGWPGADLTRPPYSLSPQWIAQDAQRRSIAQAVRSQLGAAYSPQSQTYSPTPNPSANAPEPWWQWFWAVPDAVSKGTENVVGSQITTALNSASAGIENTATTIARNVFIGGVILAALAGGFALLAYGSGVRAVPVPV